MQARLTVRKNRPLAEDDFYEQWSELASRTHGIHHEKTNFLVG